MRPATADYFRARLAASCLAGGLLAPLALVSITFTLRTVFGGRSPALWEVVSGPFLTPTGWLAAPLLGAALGALATWPAAATPRRQAILAGLAVLLGAAAAGLLALPPENLPGGESAPRGPRAIARAILRWSYRTPATVARILPYATHPDSIVREQATLALGVNLIVTDIEGATERRPARYADHPLRGQLRAALESALLDSVAGVRAEAARGLWKAPRTFGAHPAAAETLAAMLDRATLPGAVERIAWLALDAAAGAPDSALRAAVARFASATTDTELAAIARDVAAKPVSPSPTSASTPPGD